MEKVKKRYNDKITPASVAIAGTKGLFSLIWGILSTVFMVLLVSGGIVGVAMCIYLYGLACQPTGIDLTSEKQEQTSFIYLYNEKKEPVEYQRLHGTENRVWVSLDNIPKSMIEAQIAIEDKRYYEHSGVDWVRTGGAIVNLGSESSYGGSSITQQLIKNITGKNQVSITRKLTEIFKALNLEKEYTKDEILEAYLNIVNYGSGCQGVQSAANLYFAKDIKDCTVAECAAIAGITQNPAAYNPLAYPEKNKERRDVVLDQMYQQGKINRAEYNQAMEESNNMVFVGYENNEKEREKEEKNQNSKEGYMSNWYIEAMFRDLQEELSQELNITESLALNKIYSGGLKIYCAMDLQYQQFCEHYIQNVATPYDPNCQIAVVMTGLDGRVVACVGGRNKKDSMLVWDRSYLASLQPGSSIKPVIPYPIAIEQDIYNYSSMVKDQPIDQWATNADGSVRSGPANVYGSYLGEITLPDAIERSSNATAAQTMNIIGAKTAYNQAINKMYFRHLSTEDANNLGALSLGGLNGGVTVREMAAAYQYMGNGGKVYHPYTYYYVEDAGGNVILDHREEIPIQAYSSQTASMMNRLLNYNVVNNNPAHTSAGLARIAGWDILGKTGTTDSGKDHWFCGLSPYATCAVWTGYDTPSELSQNTFEVATIIFRDLMAEYLKDKESKEYKIDDTLEKHQFCAETGLLAGSYCSKTYTGYYKKDNVPEYCSGYHGGYSSYSNYNNYNNYYNSYTNNNYNSYSYTYSSNSHDDDDDDDDDSTSTSGSGNGGSTHTSHDDGTNYSSRPDTVTDDTTTDDDTSAQSGDTDNGGDNTSENGETPQGGDNNVTPPANGENNGNEAAQQPQSGGNTAGGGGNTSPIVTGR